MEILSLSKNLIRKGDEYLRLHGSEDFHLLAADLLREARFDNAFELDETLKLASRIEERVEQNYKSFEFSDLPLTLGRGDHCFIDLYFWRRRPTTIHNHHFSGAFVSLLGKNLDLEFTFHPRKQIGSHHSFGELKVKERKIVEPGDVVAIAPLDGFIHQNHHQADLTVNLCFRTFDLPGESLSNYLYSGIRYTKNQSLLMRVERLRRLLSFGPVDPSTFRVDEALTFLIQNYDSGSQHPRFLELTAHFQKMVLMETGLNVEEHLQSHWKMIEDLEEQYE